jgi:branched-subunit amino acid ABC-type transport system permease component
VAELFTGLAQGAAYALMAVGVVLVFRCTKVLSIAQGELGAFGFFYGLRWRARGVPGLGWHPSAFMTLVIALGFGALLGLVVERVIMRPLVRRPPLDALIATLGIALFLAVAELRIFGTATQFADPTVGAWHIKVFGATLGSSRVVGLVATGALAFGLRVFFTRTKFGLAVQATTGDPTVARLLGVPVNRVYRFAWVAAGLLSGLAAALLAPEFGGLTPFAQTQFALSALAGAVIGGLDSVEGAIIGSLIVGVVEAQAKAHGSSGIESVLVLVLVLGTLMVRPRGLFGATAAV